MKALYEEPVAAFYFQYYSMSKSIEVYCIAFQSEDEFKVETNHMSSNITLISRCEYTHKGKQCDKPVIQDSHFCTEHLNQPSIDLEVYKSLHVRFHHYINTTWTRTNFFFLVQAGFFTVFTGILASAANKATPYLISIDFVMGLVGLAIACLWYIHAKISLKFVKL